MPPAHQRLEAFHGVLAELDQRLVVQLEVAVLQRLTQVALQLDAGLRGLVHADVEQADDAATERLRLVERHVGVLHQPLDVLAVGGARGLNQRHADADADLDRDSIEVVGGRDERDEAMGERHRGRFIGHAVQHREFVTAEPDHQVDVADVGSQAVGDRAQQRVADRVAVGVVHRLEAVEVEAERREAAGPLVISRRGPDFAQRHAVRKVRQRVVPRHMGDARLGAAALGDVLEGRDPAAARHRPVAHRDDAPVRQFAMHRHRVVDRKRGAGALAKLVDGQPLLVATGADQLFHDLALGHADAQHVPRQAEHVAIAVVDDDEAAVGVEHAEPLAHVLERGVEAPDLLGERVLRLALGCDV